MKYFKFILVPLIVLAAAACSDDGGGGPSSCAAPVELTDEMLDGGTILPARTCWFVEENLTLDDGLLDVREGVVVTFGTNLGLRVRAGGTVRMAGTEDAPIELGTVDPLVTWRGIQMENSQGSNNDWTHVVIDNAGSSQWTGAAYSAAGVYLERSTTLAMDHVTISDSEAHGLVARGEAAFSFSNGALTGNDVPAYLHPEVVSGLGAETTFADNANAYVRVVFGNSDTVVGTHTWPAISVPYRVEDRFFVDGDLTLAPGLVVEMAQGSSMRIREGARFVAEGTPDAGIVFRAASAGTRGFWQGISISTGGTDDPLSYGAFFDFVEIADAGSDQWSGATESIAALYMQDDSAALITNTVIRNSGRYGLFASRNARIDGFADNELTDNARAMILHPDRVGELTGTSLVEGNDDDRVFVVFGNSDRVSVDATWKDLGVPYEIRDRFFIAAALTIEAGVTLEYRENGCTIVQEEGSIAALGTAESRVTFTGVDDVPAGLWKGIRIQSNDPANVLEGADFLYTGSDQWTGDPESDVALFVEDDTQLALDDVTIGPGGGYGAYLGGNDSVLSCTDVIFTGLEKGAIWDDDTNSVLPGC